MMAAILILITAQWMGIDAIHAHPGLLVGSLAFTILHCVGTFTGARE